jgi:hypothetical protein
MKYQLSAEDIAAVNRLLAWRAETVAKGHRAHVELSQSEGRDFSATIFDYAAGGVHVAYDRTVAAACDRVLARVREEERAPDTEPSNPRPSEPPPGLIPLEELMS